MNKDISYLYNYLFRFFKNRDMTKEESIYFSRKSKFYNDLVYLKQKLRNYDRININKFIGYLYRCYNKNFKFNEILCYIDNYTVDEFEYKDEFLKNKFLNLRNFKRNLEMKV